MKKILLLVSTLMMMGTLPACQQPGISEVEITRIIQSEVTKQLAGEQIKDAIELEVAGQLSNIDVLMVSSLLIVDDSGRVVASLSEFNGGHLTLRNSDGETLVSLGSLYDGGDLTIFNGSEEIVVTIRASISDDGQLAIYDKDGQVTFVAP